MESSSFTGELNVKRIRYCLLAALATGIAAGGLSLAVAQEPPPGAGPPSGTASGPPRGTPSGPLPGTVISAPGEPIRCSPMSGGPPPAVIGPQLTPTDIVFVGQPKSAARGAPFPAPKNSVVGADLKGVCFAVGLPVKDGRAVVAAENGATPAGITPLARDIFSSDDFYIDKSLWADARYYHCMSPWGIENVWGSYEGQTTGNNFPRTVSWGYCDRDVAREDMVSPYPYKTAQEHYAALKAEAASRGGPTKYTRKRPAPDWSGNYNSGFGVPKSVHSWINAQTVQTSTYVSLLTPEYQQRMVQQMWHDAHGEVIWPGAFCWPEGYMRRWFGSSVGQLAVNPELVEISMSGNGQIVVDVHLDRDFKMDGRVPYLSQDVRQYWGESIGFWDGDALIVWTSNIKHYLPHAWFENSDQLQAIEIFTPIHDKHGAFAGLKEETVFYDSEAFAQPLRVVELLHRESKLSDAAPRVWQQCIRNLFIVDGKQTAASPGNVIPYTVEDMSGRPWADVWAASEKTMQVPKGKSVEDVLSDFK